MSVLMHPTAAQLMAKAQADIDDAARLRNNVQRAMFIVAAMALSYAAVEVIGFAFGYAEFRGVWPKLISISVAYLDTIRVYLGVAALFVATVLAIGLVLVFAQWHDNRRNMRQ